MAFCRFGDDSDVYCFYSVEDVYEVWCDDEWSFKTAKEAIDCLLKLRAKGKKVPQYAIEELEGEEQCDKN